MLLKTRLIHAEGADPRVNLAVEEYLTRHVKEDEIILFLWQNEKTVVIGKNQNYWAEVNAELAEADGVTVVRRLSGGGAVYHDLGNLNFTFICRREHYNVERQLGVIVSALASLGIEARKTGRNDIEADGRKFSGNAFYKSDTGYYHHGTLMVDVDKDKLSTYLNVSESKLKSKGVKSVRSRVVNLRELRDDLTIAMLAEELGNAFAREYGRLSSVMTVSELDACEIAENREKYASWDWTYGRKLEFTVQAERRWDWGNVELQMVVSGGVIEDAVCYSDAMNETIADRLAEELRGRRYVEGEAFWQEIDEMVKKYEI